MKRRPPVKSPIAAIKAILIDRGFSRRGNTFEHQERQGDNTIYHLLPNGRVNLTVRCWRISDGWSDETMTATEALEQLTLL